MHVLDPVLRSTLAELSEYRIVICTFDNAATLWGLGTPRGSFTHIILDEVANALEAKAMIPLQVCRVPGYARGPEVYAPLALASTHPCA